MQKNICVDCAWVNRSVHLTDIDEALDAVAAPALFVKLLLVMKDIDLESLNSLSDFLLWPDAVIITTQRGAIEECKSWRAGYQHNVKGKVILTVFPRAKQALLL